MIGEDYRTDEPLVTPEDAGVWVAVATFAIVCIVALIVWALNTWPLPYLLGLR